MQSIIPVLWATLRDMPGGAAAFLDSVWMSLVGQPVCYKTQPVSLIGKTLLISVNDAAWQRTLEKMSDLLIRRINGICGDSCVQRVSFQVAPIDRVRPPAERRKYRPVASRLQESAAPAISRERIADFEVAEAIRSMVSRYL